MACEVGLYYVLHVAKQRNKNALLRLLPGLGESAVPPPCLPCAARVPGPERRAPSALVAPLPPRLASPVRW